MTVFVEFLITVATSLLVGGIAYRFAPRVPASWRARITAQTIDRVFLVAVVVFVAVYSWLAVTAHLAISSESTDLAQFDQLIWNSLQGRLLENTFVPDAPLFLGKSFVPFLLAFVPFYAVWNSPLVLLLAQPIALGASAFPIYWFARREIGRPLGLGVALTFILSPLVSYLIIIEFHEIVMAVPLLAYATFFILRGKVKPFLVTLGVTLLTKEEIAFIAAAFGVFIFLFQRKRILGLAVAMFGVAWGVWLLQSVIPFFRGSSGFYYFGSGWIAGGGSRYGYLGNSLTEIVITLLTRPDVVSAHVFTPDKIAFVFHLLVPLMGLPLVGADVALLTLPTLGYSMLSTYGWQTSIRTLYPAPLLAFLFFATIVGLRRVLARRDSFAWRATWFAMLIWASVVSYFLYAPGPFAREFVPARYDITAHSRLGQSLAATIPTDAVVVTQTELLAHLAHREQVYDPPLIPDYRQADFIVADRTRMGFQIHPLAWAQYARDGFFETVVDQDGYWIAQPRAPQLRVNARFGDAIRVLGVALPVPASRGGTTIRPVIALTAEREMRERFKIIVQVSDVRGHVWASESREPHDGKSPTNIWRVGKTVTDQFVLALPPTMPTGEYSLDVSICSLDGADCLTTQGANALTLTQFAITKDKSSYTASELKIENPLVMDARELRMLGFVSPRATITPSELFQVGVYWRARAKPQGDYIVAIQLRDASGKIAFEQSSRPANGVYPTTTWDVGEVLLDWHDFNLPRDLAPGTFAVVVVLRAGEQFIGEMTISTLVVQTP